VEHNADVSHPSWCLVAIEDRDKRGATAPAFYGDQLRAFEHAQRPVLRIAVNAKTHAQDVAQIN
jgi:hypothetical protein